PNSGGPAQVVFRDLESFLPEGAAHILAAFYNPSDLARPVFQIIFKDRRKDSDSMEPRDYRVRWWAIRASPDLDLGEMEDNGPSRDVRLSEKFILERIKARPGINIEGLAAELEGDPRTIGARLESLKSQGAVQTDDST